jgi:hexosaminidase
VNIIPKPFSIIKEEGHFSLERNPNIHRNSMEIPQTIIDQLIVNFNLLIGSVSQQSEILEAAAISLQKEKTGLGEEGYELKINKKQVIISAETAVGIFYGMQTLLQLIFQYRKEKSKVIKLPCCLIKDKPRFSWRGMHLDVSRHFFPVEFIKKYIDLLALHKMNKFHWHLTDDNGWRIEIRKYPLLTEIGAWRKDLEHLPWNEREKSDDPGNGIYGGYYSQAEIREIIKYAANRFIEVIPEIEMPGHSSEVFASYPQYSCQAKTLRVAPGGYWPNLDIFCAGQDETFDFLQDILQEVGELFPAPYIHIGGDEANKTYWKSCARCQQRSRLENLQDEKELQSYFIGRIGIFLNSIGKKMIGWDEIMEGNLRTEAIVMCWRGDGVDAALKAAEKKLKMVMCPNQVLYFDWKQQENDAGAFGVTSLEKVYKYDPTPENLPAQAIPLVLGAQGNVWTEWMETTEQVEYMAMPRLSALSEISWSNVTGKDFEEFRKRLRHFLKLVTYKGFQFNNSF